MNLVHRCVMASTAIVLVGCVSQDDYRRALADIAHLRSQRDALAKHTDELRAENARMSEQVQRLGANAADAAWIQEQKDKLAELLRDFNGTGEPIPGVTFRSGAEGLVVDVQGEVLFGSGRAEITTDGAQTLRQLAPMLIRRGQQIRIEGHTDIDPIRNSPWRTNLRLSTERSLAVAEALIAAGVPAEKVGIAGYGEHRPSTPGSDDLAKQKNRRVEILLIEPR